MSAVDPSTCTARKVLAWSAVLLIVVGLVAYAWVSGAFG